MSSARFWPCIGPTARSATSRPQDIDDLRLLIGPEVRRKHLTLVWDNLLPHQAAVIAFPVRQVVLNLLLNACRATPERGRVTLAARAEADRLVIVIDDSGPGLPDRIASFLSEGGSPAPIGAETGLGLWVARRMVAELGGTIAAETSPLGGARIRMTLPLRNEAGELAHVA